MPARSKIINIIRTAEDFLIIFDSYFRDPVWVTENAIFSDRTKQRVKKELKEAEIEEIKEPDYSPSSVLSLAKKPWDNKWRLVNFDIKEENRKTRDYVRYQLKQWGFKFFQRSAWISPLPLNQHIKHLNKQIAEYSKLAVLEGEFLFLEPRKLTAELWETEKWQNKAQKLLDKIKHKDTDLDSFKSEFWNLVLVHPRVPLDLLPTNWPLEELCQLFVNKFS